MTGSDPTIEAALAELRRLVPGGPGGQILAAMELLAERGGEPALRAAEAHIAASPLGLSYGDRDDDPSWDLPPRVFALLARWWARLGLAAGRGALMAGSWLAQDASFFGPSSSTSYRAFAHTAPLLAPHVAPHLIAACAAPDPGQRARAAAGLLYAPTDGALDTLAALLGDPAERVADEAWRALALLAHPPSPGAPRLAPSAPDGVAARLLAAVESGAPAVRRRAAASFAWFAGVQDHGSAKLPPHFARVLPALAGLLADPDPQVQRVAAGRVCLAGTNLDALRPARAAAVEAGLRLPALDLLPLLGHPEPEVVRAALFLAGRAPGPGGPAAREALGARIVALLDGLGRDAFGYPAAALALARLQHAPAIPALARRLDDPGAPFRTYVLLALGRLRHPPALPELVRLRADISYGEDARAALEGYPPGLVLPLLIEHWRGVVARAGRPLDPGPWELAYLEAHGDAAALALLRESASYLRSPDPAADDSPVVAAARRLARRLRLAGGEAPAPGAHEGA